MAKPISKNQYEPIPAGAYPAVIAEVIDIGMQPPPPMSENKEPRWEYGVKVELPTEMTSDGKPRTTWLTVSESLHPKSRLGNLYSAAGLSTEGSPNPSDLVDANVTAVVEAKQKNGLTYSNVTSFAPLPRGTPQVKAVRRDGEPPQWLQRKIDNRLDQPQDPFAVGATAGNSNTPNW